MWCPFMPCCTICMWSWSWSWMYVVDMTKAVQCSMMQRCFVLWGNTLWNPCDVFWCIFLCDLWCDFCSCYAVLCCALTHNIIATYAITCLCSSHSCLLCFSVYWHSWHFVQLCAVWYFAARVLCMYLLIERYIYICAHAFGHSQIFAYTFESICQKTLWTPGAMSIAVRLFWTTQLSVNFGNSAGGYGPDDTKIALRTSRLIGANRNESERIGTLMNIETNTKRRG